MTPHLGDLGDVPDLGTVAAIFAHPDDEAYLAAGVMAAAVDAGQRVVCCTATRGELGVTDPQRWPPERLAEIRTAELRACLDVIGVSEHRWFDLPDGACTDRHEDGLAAVEALLDEVRPDTVLAFGPDGGTFHPDHIATSRWATEAARRVVPRARVLWATKTPEWNAGLFARVDPSMVMMVEGAEPPATPREELAVHLVLDGPALDRKFAALAAQESQTAPLRAAVGDEFYRSFIREEFFVAAG